MESTRGSLTDTYTFIKILNQSLNENNFQIDIDVNSDFKEIIVANN